MTCAPHEPDIFLSTAIALWQQDAFGGGASASGVSFLMMLLQTLLALGLVCGLAYVIFRWMLPRLNVARSTGGMVRIVDRVGLDARKSLFVIEVAGRWLLVAASEAGVQLVSELDAASAEEAEREAARVKPTFGASAVGGAFAERLSQLMNRKGSKK